MSDHVEVGLGDLPWAPLHSELVDTLRYYDGPQVGVIVQNGLYYVFQAILDLPDGAGLWAYTHVEQGEADMLGGLDDPERLDEMLDGLTGHRPGKLVATHDGRVFAAVETEGASRAHVLDALRLLVDEMRDNVTELSQLVPA